MYKILYKKYSNESKKKKKNAYFHNLFPNKPWFLRVCSTSLLKTLWEKEKLLVTSNFSFSHSVFYPFVKLSIIFVKFEIVVCKLFQFGSVQNLSFGKVLISESIHFFKSSISKCFQRFYFVPEEENESSIKAMLFYGFFFLKEFCKQFNIQSLSDLKDQKLPVSAKTTQIDDNRANILLPRWVHKWSRQLACSNYGPNRAIGTSAYVKT